MSNVKSLIAKVIDPIVGSLVRKDAMLCAAADQVRRAVEYNPDCEEASSGNSAKGECYLAIVAMTMHLEAWLMCRWLLPPEPEDLRNVFTSHAFSAAQRLKFAPRFFGKCDKTVAEKYEALPLHNEINELFSDRNKIVHGHTKKFDDKIERASTIKRYWEATLDIMYEFEVCGDFGIDNIGELRAELDELKTTMRT